MNCLHMSEVCDGTIHCLQGNDEIFCGVHCAYNCRCTSISIICNLPFDQSFSTSVSKHAVCVVLTHSNFSGKISFINFKNLIFLDLSQTGSTSLQLCYSVGVFGRNSQLHYLNVSHDNLNEINSFCFFGLLKLNDLQLHNNSIHRIGPYSFSNISSINLLNLKGLSIEVLYPLSFKNSSGIILIDLSYNRLSTLSLKIFSVVPALRILILIENHLNHLEMHNIYISILITSQSKICKCVLRESVQCVVLKKSRKVSYCRVTVDFDWVPFKYEIVTFICILILFENIFVLL